ncbi:MAG: MFS transporter [Leucobacter sp.]
MNNSSPAPDGGNINPSGTGSNAPDPTLLSITGRIYFPLAFIARFPFAMSVVGVLTVIVVARGSVEIGGVASAAVGLGSAIIGPLIGAAADRFGQRPTLLITAAINSVLLGALTWVAYSDLPFWALALSAFAVGASVPQPSPMSRSRLVTIIQRDLPARSRARTMSNVLAYESAADEMVFVFGPVVVGLLATAFGAWAPILGAAVLTLVFVTAFALHHTGRVSGTAAERAATLAPANELFRPALLVTVWGIFGVGTVFGTTLTALTALMQDQGSAESAGLFYGIMGVGSAILALSVALFSPRFSLRARWVVFALVVILGQLVVALSRTSDEHQIALVITGLAISGIGIGPLLVTLYGFGAARSPEGRSATVMTMLGSAIMLGQSTGAAVTGIVAEQVGTPAALLLPAVAASGTLIAGGLNWLLTPAGARTPVSTASVTLP